MKRQAVGRRRKAGRWFSNDTAVVVLRSQSEAQTITGVTVLEKVFRIRVPDFPVLEVPTDRIKTITYKNLPSYPTDVIRTLGGGELNGDVLNDPIRVISEDLGGTVPLPKATVLSILW